MSGKRPGEGLEETSPVKRQRVSNGAAINGAQANPPQKPVLPALQAIAKAKQALELQKQLKAKLAAAGITVHTLPCVQPGNKQHHCGMHCLLL